MSYEQQLDDFLDAAFEAGKAGEPLDVDDLALDHDVHVNDSTVAQATARWRYGQTKSLLWTQTTAAHLVAGAVTSGGTNVLLTLDRTNGKVKVEEVTPDGIPWRLIDRFRTVADAFDKLGLRSPQADR